MKFLVGALCSLLVVSVASEQVHNQCYTDVYQECSRNSNLDMPRCNAKYGGYNSEGNPVTSLMKGYANMHLERSYEYLLMASFFNNYQTNRAGFSKLFKKFSDHAWEKTIELIKHVTKRGDTMDFNRRTHQQKFLAEQPELHSLAVSLDIEKGLAEEAFRIHSETTRHSQEYHDPELTQYLEEEFIEGHADKIRQLAGFTTDVKKFTTQNNGQDLSLGLYIFDEYLQKVA